MASKSLQASETSTTWTDTGGDKLLDLGNINPNGGSKVGAYLDLGVSPRADWYEAVLTIDGYNTNPLSGEPVELWFTQSNSTTGFDGQLTTDPTATTHGTLTGDQIENLKFAMVVRSYSTAAADVLQSRCRIKLTSRYVSPVVINRSVADPLSGTGDSHTLVLTPIPQEGQG